MNWKSKAPKEADIQIAVFDWAAKACRRYPELKLLHCVPNQRIVPGKGYIISMMRQGLKKGVPDLHLPVARGPFHGLWIELKRPGREVCLTNEQRWWMDELVKQNHYVAVCSCVENVIDLIVNYLED